MNKDELRALISQLLQELDRPPEPAVKGGEYYPADPGPQPNPTPHAAGDFVEDVSELDLRKLCLTQQQADPAGFAALRQKTPARLGCGRAGPRYKTLTMLRFRADHAAAQDAVWSQVPEEFAKQHQLPAVQTRCDSKETYLTRPDLGRCFDEQTAEELRRVLPSKPRVQIVIGDGLSASATLANAMVCTTAIREGLQKQGIDPGQPVFVRYCRVGGGDAIGDITGCELVCVLVGERPGLVTAQSMSAYLTYQPHTGVSESARTVVSNIHAQGTPATQAGAQIAQLIGTILEKQVSGVGLHLGAGS